MSQMLKVVVTDYVEPDLGWEEEQLARRGVHFQYYQLKFRPPAEVADWQSGLLESEEFRLRISDL
jgi:hypothetical protein